MALLAGDHGTAIREYLLVYAISLVILLALDALWLGWLARDFYRTQLGALMAETVSWVPALVFYFLYTAGLTLFVTLPGLDRADPLLRVAVLSAIFGLVAYGTYDLTNLATLRGFSLPLALVDMAWGAFLSATVGTLTTIIYKAWLAR